MVAVTEYYSTVENVCQRHQRIRRGPEAPLIQHRQDRISVNTVWEIDSKLCLQSARRLPHEDLVNTFETILHALDGDIFARLDRFLGKLENRVWGALGPKTAPPAVFPRPK